MHEEKVVTDRLELIPATAEMIRSDMNERPLLSRILDAGVPEGWAPPSSVAAKEFFLRQLEDAPNQTGWSVWYWVRRDGRVLIGNGGFKDKPSHDGTVEIGYSVLEQFQKKGYATEAVRALIQWAFSHPQVARVIAETYPDDTPSIRVLEKSDFKYLGKGSEEDTIQFEVQKSGPLKNLTTSSYARRANSSAMEGSGHDG
ncbi:GNAT family N-acetyltransferase [Candidatus Acetothermia bacterium]|nr:GNAT family N-acetyltransferase [Candidatus Acetothermia bacterium]